MRSVAALSLVALLAACGSSTPLAPPDAGTPPPDAGTPSDAPGDTGQDAPPIPSCDLPGAYSFGFDGGLVRFREVATLAPGRSFSFARIEAGAPDAGSLTCTTEVPYCATATGNGVDTLTVINAFNNADVMAVFASAAPVTRYGHDSRPVDGQVFFVDRPGGPRLEVGDECGARPGCQAIPAGVARLRQVLLALRDQELSRPECAALRP